jgi:hypothetical protein
MTKTFRVTVEAKRGARISGSKIQSAAFNTAEHMGDFRNVTVEEIPAVDMEFAKPLYALGRKAGKGWKLLDFFNTEKKAVNARGKSVANYRGCALDGTFAVLVFSPSMGVWRVEGKPVKV